MSPTYTSQLPSGKRPMPGKPKPSKTSGQRVALTKAMMS